jgi:hypothetical protein
VGDLTADTQPVQLSLFADEEQRAKRLMADRMTETLRK